jgi:hypothetical protein
MYISYHDAFIKERRIGSPVETLSETATLAITGSLDAHVESKATKLNQVAVLILMETEKIHQSCNLAHRIHEF